MIRQLRIKFVVVNMMIVTFMLGIIFCCLYYFTGSSLENESIQMMRTIALNPFQMARPTSEFSEFSDVRLPYFSVTINRTGDLIETAGGFFDLTDSELVETLIEKSYEEHGEIGVLEEYNLRYLRAETPRGNSIVFADITSEQKTLRSLIRNFAIVGTVAFFGFLLISCLLARWAVSPVEKAWKNQKQFVADASHELKTPLTVIMTDAELIRDESCSAEDKNQLSDSILSMSHQMRGLVESMLELARIDSGSIQKKMDTVSFSDIALDAAMIFEPVFFEKNLLLNYDVEPDIKLKGDAVHLKQLVDILLDNAAKYSSENGQTTLTLKRTTHNHCRLTVANQGPQIEPEDLANLFKRFYRADKARSMNHSYGLGLSIAETVAEEHKGKIRAESEGGYNRFIFEV